MRASSVITVPLLASVEVQAVGPNNRRVRLLFTGPDVGIAYARTDSLGNNKGGLVIDINNGKLDLTIEEHGDIVKAQWFLFNTSASVVGILETIH